MSVKKCMRILVLGAYFAYIFFVLSGCGSTQEDSGAYEAALDAFENGDYDLALSLFQEAADVDERYAEAYRGMGLVYLSEGQYEEAVDFFELSLLNMESFNEEFENDVLLYKAEALYRNSQIDEALSVYAELEEQGVADAYALEGRIYFEQGDIQTAAGLFSTAVELEVSIGVCLMIYEEYRSINLEGDGAAYLEIAIQIEAETAAEQAMLGLAYYYLSDTENAALYFNQAISAGYVSAADILGNIYIESGAISSARALYEDILNSGDNIAMAYNGLALCSLEEEDYETALYYIELGLSCDDDTARQSLLFNEVVIYERMLDFDTAAEKAAVYINEYPADEEMQKELTFLSRETEIITEEE